MDFEHFCAQKLKGCTTVYWCPFPGEAFAVCAIRLKNGMSFSGDSSAEPSLYLETGELAEIKHAAKEAALEKLRAYCVASYHEEVLASDGEEEYEHYSDPDILLDEYCEDDDYE